MGELKMARGRKKGGISINDINDKTQLVNMIINQVNSLNKKIKNLFNDKSEYNQIYAIPLN